MTHHQAQFVTMLRPILMVAPPAPLQETHIHSTSPLSLCSSLPPTGTNSTNAVGGSGGLSQSQGGSQCLSAPQQRKGTFTDDLHKLVDNWARDAMNLSQVEDQNSYQAIVNALVQLGSNDPNFHFHQGKRSAKQLQQAPAQGHSYEVSSNPIQINYHLLSLQQETREKCQKILSSDCQQNRLKPPLRGCFKWH